MRKIRTLSAVILMVSMLIVLAGCGEQSIAGHWELRETQWGDGYFATWEYYADEGIYMSYDLDEYGGTFYYTSPNEDIAYDFTYSYDKEGHFWFDENTGVCYHAVTLKGDTFTYVETEGDKEVTYVFDRTDE